MDWERASPRSEAVVVVVGDKKNQCINSSVVHDLSNNNKSTATSTGGHVSRKNKPIPPPLDLSIGAANLSLHHLHPNLSATTANHLNHIYNHHSSSSLSPNQLPPPHHSSPWSSSQQNSPHTGLSPFLSSPKFSISDKKLPPRKRWHSWSPVLMNPSPDELSPLYRDAHASMKSEQNHDLTIAEVAEVSQHGQGNVMLSTFSYVSVSAPSSSASSMSSTSPAGGMMCGSNSTSANNYRLTYGHIGSPLTSSGGLNTPSPFYTPNEQSPKFMNSPVFSYSAPDTSLYNGPYTPTRSSMYAPPSSPFTNLNLSTPGGPMSSGSVSGTNSNNCFNMIPSTLLSPAPSQASTNSLSYEDLHEKSINFVTPVWSIFLSGTKVRFHHAHPINSMEWYSVDALAQNDSNLNFKGEYAPHGLEVRTLVTTSSSKERIQITFCPVGDPDHPVIEVDCEPSHPFLVDKKGWCAVKPDVFMEAFGTHCLSLECGDICSYHSRLQTTQLNIHQSGQQSNNGNNQQQHTVQQQHSSMHLHNLTSSLYGTNSINAAAMMNNSHGNANLINVPLGNLELNGTNGNMSHNSLTTLKVDHCGLQDVKPLPSMSTLSQSQSTHQQPPQQNNVTSSGQHPMYLVQGNTAKKFAVPSSSGNGGALQTPNKRTKEKDNVNGARGCQASSSTEEKGRRPMNAFLLFAKDKRQELIQQYPGKDNRSISVMLGEIWKSMGLHEKEKYNSSSRAKAEEQKRIHPDCWKRKRSQSTSSATTKKAYVNNNSANATVPKNAYLQTSPNASANKNASYLETPTR